MWAGPLGVTVWAGLGVTVWAWLGVTAVWAVGVMPGPRDVRPVGVVVSYTAKEKNPPHFVC